MQGKIAAEFLSTLAHAADAITAKFIARSAGMRQSDTIVFDFQTQY